MRIITAEDLSRVFTFPSLIEALRGGFRSEIVTPARHHHTIERPGEPNATLLLMPAWTGGAHGTDSYVGVKIASVYPANAARGLPSVSASYVLMDGETGAPIAMIDGGVMTLWRTAAASGLAASYLARQDASRLVMVGAGALAPYLIGAHAAIRPVEQVAIWNRNRGRAERLAAELADRPYAVEAVDDLEAAVRAADIVSCATLAEEPLVEGEWLKPGAHLDLVGAFTPTRRESDDAAVRRARVYVDTRAGALAEAGDIVQPLHSGVISEADICGDLFDLCRDAVAGRQANDEVTLFKSVGTALEDLAAAALAFSAKPAATSD
jgi:ornithine cyclodeaminase/alanine dehydrogenase-like protein (mu-crystallin family)